MFVANGAIVMNMRGAVDDATLDATARFDDYIREDDAVDDLSASRDTHPRSDNRSAHKPVDATAVTNQTVADSGRGPHFGGRHFGAFGVNDPIGVTDVERRCLGQERHAGLVVGLHGADIGPVPLKVIGVHLGVAHEFGHQIAADILFGGGAQHVEQVFFAEQVDAH